MNSITEKIDEMIVTLQRIRKVFEAMTTGNTITSDTVIDLVRQNPGSTANELGNMVGDTTDKIRKLLYSLLKQKKVIQSGSKICDITNHEAVCWWVKN